MAKKNPITVGFIALGCPKNVVDSEKMLAEIARGGLLITAEPNEADVVVINTCGFIVPAKAEALDLIRQALDCKTAGAVKKVIVAGCLAERLGEKLFEEADGIDAIVGLGQRDNIASIIEKTIQSDTKHAYLTHSRQLIQDDRVRLRIGPSHWAYLRISEGCDHKCAFCTIPAIKGQFRSKSLEMVLDEAEELTSAGAVELVVIGQDITSYGRDLKMKNGLAAIAGELEKIPQLGWIRLMYLYPAAITDQLIGTIAKSEKIVHYIDMPIQHINNEILKKMRRPDTKERICELIERLRAQIPDVILRTTLIVGMPGETDRQFDELLEFVKWADFDALGCFKYYAEAGTAAAEMADQVPERIKKQRLEKLMLAQQETAFAKNKKRVGTELCCLVDSVDDECRGRFYGQAPDDIDSNCIIRNCRSKAGQFIKAKVVGTENYDLIVEQINY